MPHTRIWDLPTRLFHWTLAASVAGLFATGTLGGNWMEWHLRLGHLVLALLAFRLLWGFVGGRWSRFSSFLFTPARTVAYWRGQTTAQDHIGHNPIGALAVWAMLLLLTVQVLSGLGSDDEIAYAGPLTRYLHSETVSFLTGYHHDIGKLLLLGLVALHLLALVYYQVVRKLGLVKAMFTGDKPIASPASADGPAQRLLAAVLFLCCVALSWWVMRLGV